MQAQQIFHVTAAEAAQILFETILPDGQTSIAYVRQRTAPDILKKDRVSKEARSFDRVEKETYCSIILNSVYERAVERQLEKENKDISEYQKGQNTMLLTYGEKNIFIGLYNGQAVLQYRPNDAIKPKTKYFVDGKETDKAEIVNFLPLPKAPKNQGTVRVIPWRKVYLKNFLEISLLGKKYIIIDGGQAV